MAEIDCHGSVFVGDNRRVSERCDQQEVPSERSGEGEGTVLLRPGGVKLRREKPQNRIFIIMRRGV